MIQGLHYKDAYNIRGPRIQVELFTAQAATEGFDRHISFEQATVRQLHYTEVLRYTL